MEKRIESLMFTDVSGYSKLTEPQFKSYMEKALPEVGALFEEHRDKFTELNTWGDATVAVCPDPYLLARLALDFRDLFRNRNWKDDHLPNDLSARIALHAGTIYVGKDPIRDSTGIIGSQVNLAARIEPVTSPNEVWVTDQFMKLIDSETDDKLAFDDLGERPLAKKFGSTRLWNLRRDHDPKKDIQDITVQPIQSPTSSKELELAIHMSKHGTEQQRVVALDLLDQFNVSESTSALIEVARDKNAATSLRSMALASISNLKNRIAVPDLMAIVDDVKELPHIVGQAIETLGNMRDVRALPSIQNALLGDRELEAKAIGACIVAIAKIGDSKGIPTIKIMLEQRDKFRSYLRYILTACAALPDPSFIPDLQEITKETNLEPATRQSALSALLFNNPTLSENLFIDLAKDANENNEIKFHVIGLLAAIQTTNSKELLQEIASDLSNPLCTRALTILTKGSDLLKKQKKDFLSTVTGG